MSINAGNSFFLFDTYTRKVQYVIKINAKLYKLRLKEQTD